MPQTEMLSEFGTWAPHGASKERWSGLSRNRGAPGPGLIAFRVRTIVGSRKRSRHEFRCSMPGCRSLFGSMPQFCDTRFNDYLQHHAVPEPEFLQAIEGISLHSRQQWCRGRHSNFGSAVFGGAIWEDWDLWLRLAQTHVFVMCRSHYANTRP